VTALALPDLAQAIDREHQAAIGAARSAIEHAVACGRRLLEAKAAVGHGGWIAWVEANLSFSHRQAQKYARLAKFTAGKSELAKAHLTLDGALAAIAEPKPKPDRPRPKPKWEPANPIPAPAPEPKAVEPAPFSALAAIQGAFDQLPAREKNEFSRWVLEYQLRQTDLAANQKRDLGKILEILAP
jgi:hypothetical protein